MESIVPPVLQVRILTRGRDGQQPHHSAIFPFSLPGSKLHHERGVWSLLLAPAPKPSDCLPGLARPATPQPCPPLGLGSLLLSPTSTLLSILSTLKLVPTTQVPAPMSPLCLNSNAKPYPLHSPPAHLMTLTPVFSFFLNSKHCSLKHCSDYLFPWCVSTHSFSNSKARAFVVHHSQIPD